MYYFNINLDWDPKVIGVKNGIYQVELDKKAYDKRIYTKLDSLFISGDLYANQVYPDIDFKLCFKKLKSARKTNFMSFTPYLKHCMFLVQSNTLELFQSFHIQSYKDYEALIYDSPTGDVDNSFRLFYSVLQDWNIIDFEKTIFTSGGVGNNLKIEHKFSDENDLRNFNGIAKVKKLALSDSFDGSLDLFHTRLGGLFVSEKFKLALERNNVTGIKFTNEVEVLI